MLARLRSRAQEEKGFTLIELLVVVLIIGILAAIAIPAFLGQKKGAQDANAKSLLRNTAITMESYYSDNQSFDGPAAASGTALVAADLSAIEPNITFIIGGTAGVAKKNEVNVIISASGAAGTPNNRYVLATNSASGNFYTYFRDETAKTMRCKAATAAAPTWGAGSVPSACTANQW